MRSSKFFFTTLKEAPADAEVISQKLMLRAGYIKRVAAGIYTWMPMGLRVLRKVENIVREEMDAAGAVELLMPAVQPAELWQESGRFEKYGAELLRFKDRHQRDFVIGPTHEEVITDVVRRDVKSYRELPVNLYQIQTKFRDEIRPRFGVMRGREFLMKDAYSFHANFADLEREYQNMYATYSRIFSRLGLAFRAVAADNGAIGGTGSHEFHVLADSGEDAIAFCPDSDYAANVETATTLLPEEKHLPPTKTLEKIATPQKTACADVAEFLQISLQKIIKTIAVVYENEQDTLQFALLLLRADHSLNEVKARKYLKDFRLASAAEIVAALSCPPGFIGPLSIDHNKIQVFSDHSAAVLSDFVCGANLEGFHYTGVNFGRDLPLPAVFDFRNVAAGDLSPDGKGRLEICRGIEVGHVFQLRQNYAQALDCGFLDESGKRQIMEMGCYGIGVSRIVGAAIEQGHDEKGILLPKNIAPFTLCIVPMGYAKNPAIKAAADTLYKNFLAAGVDVLLDDRDERPGVLFADMELIGVPHRLVIGERGLKEGKIEYKGRGDAESQLIAETAVLPFILEKLQCD